ncbi:MAG: tetratricopeptide repeat protein [Magnetococcales bacterium]|nr:tetratricopeptide repeat protein [Magnetococcales bacterium]
MAAAATPKVNPLISITAAAIDALEKQRLAQRFSSIDGYLMADEGYLLYRWAKEGPGTGAVVEIGSFMGLSTCWLAAGSQAAERGPVVACDSFRGIDKEGSTTLPQFQDNIQQTGLRAYVDIQVGTSIEMARSWSRSRPIRLLFLDADHAYQATQSDLQAWFPYVEPGGIIAFHDIGTLYGCSRLYSDLLRRNPDLVEVGSADSLRLIRKPSSPMALSLPHSTKAAWHDYQQQLHSDPLDIETILQLGTLHFENRRFNEAERCYRTVMQLAPSGHNGGLLSLILAMQSKITEAIDCYDRAIGMDPKLATSPIQLTLAQICLTHGHNDQAAFFYRRILANTPGLMSALVYNNLATALQRQNKIDEALACYRHALSIDPNMTSAYNSIASIMAAQGHFEAAIDHYERAIATDPQFIHAQTGLVALCYSQGLYDKAEAYCRRALDSNPNSVELWGLLSVMAGRQGRVAMDQSLEYLQRAATLKPDDTATRQRLDSMKRMLQQRITSIEQMLMPSAVTPPQPAQ